MDKKIASDWCEDHGYTDLYSIGGGGWAAFPPGGAISEPVPVRARRSGLPLPFSGTVSECRITIPESPNYLPWEVLSDPGHSNSIAPAEPSRYIFAERAARFSLSAEMISRNEFKRDFPEDTLEGQLIARYLEAHRWSLACRTPSLTASR